MACLLALSSRASHCSRGNGEFLTLVVALSNAFLVSLLSPENEPLIRNPERGKEGGIETQTPQAGLSTFYRPGWWPSQTLGHAFLPVVREDGSRVDLVSSSSPYWEILPGSSPNQVNWSLMTTVLVKLQEIESAPGSDPCSCLEPSTQNSHRFLLMLCCHRLNT